MPAVACLPLWLSGDCAGCLLGFYLDLDLQPRAWTPAVKLMATCMCVCCVLANAWFMFVYCL